MTSPAGSSAVIQAKAVQKTFKRGNNVVHAVNDVSLSITAGETVGLIGESGSGKTTLGRLMLGLLPPDEGEILFEGTSLGRQTKEELRRLRSRMQVVFQEPYESLNPKMKVSAIIAEPLVVQGTVPAAERQQRVADALDHVSLSRGLGDRYPRELSGGQQQRVGIARAIVGRPRFIVLDEPTASLDRSIRRQITDLIMGLQQEMGLSYLLITHDMASVRRMASRALVLYRGNLVESGPTAEVLAAPGHPYTRGLVTAELAPRPGIRQDRYRLKPRLPGAPSNPQGCPLVPICPLAVDECSARKPPLLDMGGDHRAACIRWKDLLAISARGAEPASGNTPAPQITRSSGQTTGSTGAQA